MIAGQRAKWLVLAGWLAIIVVLGPLAGKLQGAESNNAASFLPASAQSTQVYNLQHTFHDSDATTAVVVYTGAHGGQLAMASRAVVERIAGRIPGASKPAISSDGQAMQFTVPLAAANGDSISSEVNQLRGTVRAGSLQVHVTGPAGLLGDSTGVYKNIDGHLLMVTLAVVIALLLLIYRSPLLWLVPVVAAGAGLAVAQAIAYLLAEHAGLTVNGLSGSLMLILVFGAGTDYALLLVARYREELHYSADKHDAMGTALRRAAPAIIASAATVALGLLCLLLSDLASNRGLGPVAVIGVLSALAVMITLLPALLVCLPRGIMWPSVPGYGQPPRGDHRLWTWMGTRIARSPARIWATALVALAAMALGLAVLHASGLSQARQFTGTRSSGSKCLTGTSRPEPVARWSSYRRRAPPPRCAPRSCGPRASWPSAARTRRPALPSSSLRRRQPETPPPRTGPSTRFAPACIETRRSAAPSPSTSTLSVPPSATGTWSRRSCSV
jgi:putative drug exporter of the RND superfamily